MVQAIRCRRMNMNNSIINGSKVSSLPVAIQLALRSFEQQDSERAVLTFSNGDVRAKIRTWVKDNAIHFYLWDQGDWRSCDWH